VPRFDNCGVNDEVDSVRLFEVGFVNDELEELVEEEVAVVDEINGGVVVALEPEEEGLDVRVEELLPGGIDIESDTTEEVEMVSLDTLDVYRLLFTDSRSDVQDLEFGSPDGVGLYMGLGSVVDCIEDGGEVSVASAETGTSEPKLFAVDAVAAAALVSLHRAKAMRHVSDKSSTQGSQYVLACIANSFTGTQSVGADPL